MDSLKFFFMMIWVLATVCGFSDSRSITYNQILEKAIGNTQYWKPSVVVITQARHACKYGLRVDFVGDMLRNYFGSFDSPHLLKRDI